MILTAIKWTFLAGCLFLVILLIMIASINGPLPEPPPEGPGMYGGKRDQWSQYLDRLEMERRENLTRKENQ